MIEKAQGPNLAAGYRGAGLCLVKGAIGLLEEGKRDLGSPRSKDR